MKVCSKCKIEKPSTSYHKNCKAWDGLHPNCKDCRKDIIKKHNKQTDRKRKWTQEYRKTKKGLLVHRYDLMQKRSRDRFNTIISKEMFVETFLKCKELDILMDNYRESNYDIRLAPSIDRVDNNLGYVEGNLQFITLSENSKKSDKEIK